MGSCQDQGYYPKPKDGSDSCTSVGDAEWPLKKGCGEVTEDPGDSKDDAYEAGGFTCFTAALKVELVHGLRLFARLLKDRGQALVMSGAKLGLPTAPCEARRPPRGAALRTAAHAEDRGGLRGGHEGELGRDGGAADTSRAVCGHDFVPDVRSQRSQQGR